MSSSNQQTILKSVSISGKGLHTGLKCDVVMHPADINTGVVFHVNGSRIPADTNHVSDTRRGTSLSDGKTELHTVEHLLSALAGLHIDNVEIELTGTEIPIMDGSSFPFVQMIDTAGIFTQNAPARYIEIDDLVWIIDGERFISASVFNGFSASVFMSYNHPLIGDQGICINMDPDVYRNEIAPARTFCTSQEIDYILSQGLGKGGDENNVVIAYDDRYSLPLRFENELVRHKLLDLIGDLSLIKCRLNANIAGLRTGHKINTDFAAIIYKKFEK